MNDFMRDKLSSKDGKIPLWAEMLAGGMVRMSDIGTFCICTFLITQDLF